MKQNLILAAICLLCALLLVGCGSTAPAATPAPTEVPAPVESPAEETAVPEASPTPEATPTPVASLPDAGLVPDTDTEDTDPEALLERAKSFVDKPLSELQEEFGEPLSSTYVSSCLIPGGQDGELHYNGFTVYTVKSGNSETVQDVLAD